MGRPSLAEINAEIKALGVQLAEARPTISLASQQAQLFHFIRNNYPWIGAAQAQGLAASVVAYTSTRPRSIVAEAAADPVGSFLTGLGGLSGWQQVVFRMAVGAVGIVLILFGIALIGGEVTLNNVARNLGKSIGTGIRGKGK